MNLALPHSRYPGDWCPSYVGDLAKTRRGISHINYPIEHGIVTKWDHMERIWRHCFNRELRVDQEDHPVLLTDKPTNPMANREKMTQLMFESLQVPAMSVQIDAVLAIYASGTTTGVALDVGESVTHAVPVLDGRTLSALEPDSGAPQRIVQRLSVGGHHLTNYMHMLLSKRGCNFTTTAELEIVQDIKEKVAYAALGPEAELKKLLHSPTMSRTYELPDGSTIDNIGQERFLCPELLFDPVLGGHKGVGVHELIYNAVTKCKADLRARLYNNIVVCGGSSMFPGLGQRLQAEVAKLIQSRSYRHLVALQGLSAVHAGALRETGYLRRHITSFCSWLPSFCRCEALPERKHSVWVGGAILSSLPKFQSMWITKEEFEDAGPGIVHRKCF